MNQLLRTLPLLLLLLAGMVLGQRQTYLGVDADRANIPLDQILRGNVPQGIPALGHEGDWLGFTAATTGPSFIGLAEASAWLREREPVVVVTIAGETRGYPLQILTWHEIVNDTIAGVPVAVTFCPLCNSAIAFDRRIPLTADRRAAVENDYALARIESLPASIDLDESFLEAYRFQHGEVPDFVAGLAVTFGTTGLLFNSNLLMFDSRTSTFWSQILGEGNVGTLTGTRLLNYPAQIMAFEELGTAFPEARILSRDTGFTRTYGTNPYVGYDDVDNPPFLFQGMTDGRLPPKARVVSVALRGESVAYPFEILASRRVVNDSLAGETIVVFWQEGTSSALDTQAIASGRDIGAVGVFSRRLGDRELSFGWDGEAFVDEETGSSWNLSGQAVAGELAGSRLRPVVHDNTLWFAWAAFRPETRLYGSEE